ncbi:Uncharacterised protein [uncultured Clostridium sp.]|nr:Uncharacterised protein [uncultured Clostridium sp.]
MQDLSAQGGQFQHLVIGDLVQLPGPLDGAGIGGEHAVHIGVDLTQVGMQGGRQSHRRGIRTPPPQCGNVAILVDALESGDDDDLPLVQLRQNTLGTDVLDPGRAIGRVGFEAGLPACQRDHRIPHRLNGHGAQGAGNLLAGREQHVHLPLGGLGIDLPCFGDEVIRSVSLCGEDHHQAVSPAVGLRNDAGHVADPVRIRDGGPAEFLYNE